MNYEVYWNRNALIALANIWNTSTDPSSVARSQAEIDRRLKNDPSANGEEVAEALLRIIVLPLVAYYEVHPELRQIWVTNVGTVYPPGRL